MFRATTSGGCLNRFKPTKSPEINPEARAAEQAKIRNSNRNANQAAMSGGPGVGSSNLPAPTIFSGQQTENCHRIATQNTAKDEPTVVFGHWSVVGLWWPLASRPRMVESILQSNTRPRSRIGMSAFDPKRPAWAGSG